MYYNYNKIWLLYRNILGFIWVWVFFFGCYLGYRKIDFYFLWLTWKNLEWFINLNFIVFGYWFKIWFCCWNSKCSKLSPICYINNRISFLMKLRDQNTIWAQNIHIFFHLSFPGWSIWVFLMLKFDSKVLSCKHVTEFDFLCFVNHAWVLLLFTCNVINFNQMLLSSVGNII